MTGVTVKPLLDVVAIELLSPNQSGKRLALDSSCVFVLDVFLQIGVGCLITENMVVTMGCDFVSPGMYFADEMRKAFCDPTQYEECGTYTLRF